MTAEAEALRRSPTRQIPCRVAQLGAASAARPPTAASAHLAERTLTRCAKTQWSPTW